MTRCVKWAVENGRIASLHRLRKAPNPMQRVFLDWSQPALSSATRYLLELFDGDPVIDLSETVVVVPGGRAGRRLGKLLLREAQRSGRAYFPPHITTVGSLPEILYEPRLAFADPISQRPPF